MIRTVPALLSLALLFGPHTSQAASITYTVANYPQVQNGLILSGTITTDGTLGPITAADITTWLLTISTPLGGDLVTFRGSDQLTNSDSTSGSLIATASGFLELATPTSGLNSLSFGQTTGGPAGRQIVWLRTTNPSQDAYSANTSTPSGISTILLWGVSPPPNDSLGGDPWVIAVPFVPEPPTFTLALVGMACVGLTLLVRRLPQALTGGGCSGC
jgi:hypothetical protein